MVIVTSHIEIEDGWTIHDWSYTRYFYHKEMRLVTETDMRKLNPMDREKLRARYQELASQHQVQGKDSEIHVVGSAFEVVDHAAQEYGIVGDEGK